MDLTFPEFECIGQTLEPNTAREFDKEGAAPPALSQEDHGDASLKQTGTSKGNAGDGSSTREVNEQTSPVRSQRTHGPLPRLI
jgi:hypothetical protein